MTADVSLRLIKTIHTIVWAFFVVCIVAIPVFGFVGSFGLAAAFIGLVFIEVLILTANRMRCPLTDMAARYTNDRSDNYDIYLPLWLARNNKIVFGLLFLVGVLFTFLRWLD